MIRDEMEKAILTELRRQRDEVLKRHNPPHVGSVLGDDVYLSGWFNLKKLAEAVQEKESKT